MKRKSEFRDKSFQKPSKNLLPTTKCENSCRASSENAGKCEKTNEKVKSEKHSKEPSANHKEASLERQKNETIKAISANVKSKKVTAKRKKVTAKSEKVTIKRCEKTDKRENGKMTKPNKPNIKYDNKAEDITSAEGDFFLKMTRKGSKDEVENGFKQISCFLVKKALENNTNSSVLSASVQKDGTITIHVKNLAAAKVLLKLSEFSDIKCDVKKHANLNVVKGVVYCPEFRYLDEKEILDGLADQGVTAIHRLKKRPAPGEIISEFTGMAFLTFSGTTLPEEINVGYEKVEVREFIPDPMRCFKCLSFGHTKKNCKAPDAICGNCAGKAHLDPMKNEKCTKAMKCVNCKMQSHGSFSRECKVWITEKEIQVTKVRMKVSYFRARQLVTKRNPQGGSYSRVVSTANAVCPGCCKQKPTVEQLKQMIADINGHKAKKTGATPKNSASKIPPTGEAPSGETPSGATDDCEMNEDDYDEPMETEATYSRRFQRRYTVNRDWNDMNSQNA